MAFTAVKICEICTQFLLIQHALACMWYKVGSLASANSAGWVVEAGRGGGQTATDNYMAALYWMFCSLGFGVTELEPRTKLERAFGIFASVLAMAMFSTILGTIASQTSILSKSAQEYRQQFWQLNRSLIHVHADQELSQRVIHFLHHAFSLRHENHIEQPAEILSLLSKPLWCDLQVARFRGCLNDLGFVIFLSETLGDKPAESQLVRRVAMHAISEKASRLHNSRLCVEDSNSP